MMTLKNVMARLDGNKLIHNGITAEVDRCCDEIIVSGEFYGCNNWILTIHFYFDYNGELSNIVAWDGCGYVLFDGINGLTDPQIDFIEKILNGTLL